jgi:ATP-dependent Lon protease
MILSFGKRNAIKAIEHSLSTNKMIMLIAQKDLNAENPSPSDLYNVGTVGLIMRMLKLPDGRVKVLVQGLTKAKTVKFLKEEPFFTASIEKITDTQPEEITIETEAIMRTVKEQIDKTARQSNTPDIMIRLKILKTLKTCRPHSLKYRLRQTMRRKCLNNRTCPAAEKVSEIPEQRQSFDPAENPDRSQG